MDKWKKQDIDNERFKELCENFYYYKRKEGVKSLYSDDNLALLYS